MNRALLLMKFGCENTTAFIRGRGSGGAKRRTISRFVDRSVGLSLLIGTQSIMSAYCHSSDTEIGGCYSAGLNQAVHRMKLELCYDITAP